MSARRQWALALALIGVVGLVICVALFAGVYVAGDSVRGRVVDLSYHGSGGDPTCFPMVEYTVEGERHRSSTRVGSSPCPHRVGDAVTVYYWPNHPSEPSLLSFGELLPLFIPLALFAIALHLAVRSPKATERVAETVEVTASSASDGQLVKLRGVIDLAAGAEPLSSPIRGRACVACWTRVVERVTGKPDRKVQDESRSVDFVVSTSDGDARVAVASAPQLVVDADGRGECDYERSAVLEAFLARHDHPAEVIDTTAHHYVWYEGLFLRGEEVFVVGLARRGADGALEIVAPEDGRVVLQHVDRDERKRAAQHASR